MSPTLEKLLADCRAKGIRLSPAGRDRLTIDGPANALTPDFVGRLKTHKHELLTLLSSVCPRCGSSEWCDVAIHGGQSIRRDCARCGRFLDFPRWYGRSVN